MRLKSELYEKEQGEIIDKIIKIMDLDTNTKYTLYQLDRDIERQDKLIKMIPEIRKYFSFNGIKAVGSPEKIKRPWLSIIKMLTKTKYCLNVENIHTIYNDEPIRTQEYTFVKL